MSLFRDAQIALAFASTPLVVLRAQGTVTASLDSLKGTWSAEFLKTGSLLDSATALRLQVSFPARTPDSPHASLTGSARWGVQLGEDPIARLFGHADPCVRFDPNPVAYNAQVGTNMIHGDSIDIWFTPGAADCGLGAVGVIRGDLFIGRWYEPRFTGYGAQGIFRMKRQRP